MVQQNILKFILLGAGAELAASHPAQWFEDRSHHHHHHHHHSSVSFSGIQTGGSFPFPTGTGFPFTTGKSLASPTGTGILPSSNYTGLSSLPSVSAPPSSSVSTAAAVAGESGTSTPVKVVNTVVKSAGAAAASSVSKLSVSASSGCTFTDAASAIASKTSCSSIVLNGIAVPAGQTLDMTGLKDGTTVTFEGTTTFGYKEWTGPLISFSGKSITIQGASGHLIDGNGPSWWDGKGGNGGKTKPKFFYTHSMTDSTVTGLNIKNTPVQCFSVSGATNLKFIDVTIEDSAGDGSNGGHNTDAWDIGSSTGVHITGANVKNQDDCVAVNSGTDISFTGGTCSGGHGLSIGSVGGRSDNNVANVVFSDSTVANSQNGCRIKTVSGATGSVQNVTYSGITLSGITNYGIVVEQDYQNGGPTGTLTSGVPITQLTLENITGVGSVSGGQPYYILCASCSAWTVTGVSVTGGKQSKKCQGEPSGVTLC